METTTWTPARARAFARGLYEVAACDGIDPREAKTIRGFLSRAGLPTDLETIGSQPFDVVQAAKALDSAWLRKIFIQTCELLTRVDGEVSESERDIMRALAAGLGVGERVALDSGLANQPQPADLVDWIASRPVDLISWDDEAQSGFFWDFPHRRHPIAEGAMLEVTPSQRVVIHDQGAITDVLNPGEHAVSPQTLPHLARRLEWRSGPVVAAVTFLSTVTSDIWRWGTTDSIVVDDPEFGPIPLQGFGRFSVSVRNPARAFVRFARNGALSVAHFETRTRRMVGGRFAEALRRLVEEDGQPVVSLLGSLRHLAKTIQPHMEDRLSQAGLKLCRFVLENVTAPTAVTEQVERLTVVGRVESNRALVCAECQAELAANARFCSNCGARQLEHDDRCTGCSRPIAPHARFCPSCGTRRNQT